MSARLADEKVARPIYETGLLNLAKSGSGIVELKGQLQYLIKVRPLSLPDVVERTLHQGITWEETLDTRLMG